jgi:hypothetical protein
LTAVDAESSRMTQIVRLCHHQQEDCDHPGWVVVRGWGGERLRSVCVRCGSNEPRGQWLRRADHPGWRDYPLLVDGPRPCPCPRCDESREYLAGLDRRRQEDEARRQRWLERGLSRQVRPDWTFDRYEEYLASPQWRARREAAIAAAGRRCQLCNASEMESFLQAHHRTYERLGEEASGDLTILCSECHEYFHRVFGLRWD